MKRQKAVVYQLMVGVTITALMSACSSGLVPLAPQLPAEYTKLGRVSGRGCGMLVPYAGAEQCVPIMVPSRIDRAYASALASAPGATALSDVTIQDDWLWPLLGLYICTTISGEAVR